MKLEALAPALDNQFNELVQSKSTHKEFISGYTIDELAVNVMVKMNRESFPRPPEINMPKNTISKS